MYKLLLIGCFTSWRNNTSCEFFSEELAKRFSKLPVSLIKHHFNDLAFPEADIALIHAYDSTEAVQQVSEIKKKVKKVVLFMEEPKYEFGFDHCYFYNHKFIHGNKGTYIRIPLAKDQYEMVPKEPGSILLDHDCQLFPDHGISGSDWTDRLWAFFEKNKQYRPVYQLERGPVSHPDFIKKISIQSHQDYLSATAHIETFICTHAGSYNHTAVDMAVRGSKVIVPMVPGTFHNTFVPECLVRDLNMALVLNEQQLGAALNLIKTGSRRDRPAIDMATDLDEVVSIMDRDFKSWTRKKVVLP